MVKINQDLGGKLRVLLIQRTLLNSRNGKTINELTQRFGVSKDSIRRDLKILSNAGFIVDIDKKYRYHFKKEEEYKQLKDLLHFSEEEQIILHKAIDSIEPYTKRASILKKKLASLYDFRKLGLSYLNAPYLQKINLINEGMKNKQQIVLKNYKSSNSNKIENKYIEPIHINTSEDILYAFDIKTKTLKNYKISRIGKVALSKNDWEYEGHHYILHTDPFRISSKNMVMVHMRITLAGKNYLEEMYPITKSFINETQNEGIYDFQTKVNDKFLGLDNFILGYHREIVEIISPENLIIHLKNQIECIKNIEGFF